MMENFTNVGKPGNMARFMLLYTKSIRFYRKIASRFCANPRYARHLRKSQNFIFLQISANLQKIKRGLLSVKMKNNNQTLRNQNAGLYFTISATSFFVVYRISKLQKTIHKAKS